MLNRKIISYAAVLAASAVMLSSCSEGADNNTVQENTETVSSAAETEISSAEVTEAENVREEQTEEILPSAELSHKSGVYADPFQLTISAAEEGELYYTLDGSDPAKSDTAVLYTAPINITDRKADKNVVSAVDPVLFAGSFNHRNEERDGFYCDIKAPSDAAVDKCTVVRAAVKKSDGSFGREVSSTYFIGTAEDHIKGLKASCEAAGTSLAVVSISMDYDDLFDSKTGIYVKGDIFDRSLAEYLKTERLKSGEDARSMDANYKQKGREWEREASVSFMEFSADGRSEEVISQKCGIRIQGNYSRSDAVKGFRLYARTDYGEKNFKYPVLGSECTDDSGQVIDKFDTLVLRNGGNCAFTTKFSDTYWQSMLGDTACDIQRSRPCVVYINGEYWGLYVLQEDYSDDYFEDHHGVNKDDVVLYKGDAEALKKGYKLDIGDAPAGESDDSYFKPLKDFFKTHSSLKSQSDYDEFVKLVDPQSVMDYFAVQCWINNKWDWPGKNWSMWKTVTVDESNPYNDGRWRFVFYDIEFGGVSGENDAFTNTIKEDNYKPKGLLDMDTNNPAVLCFAYLMTNEGFRNDFYERLNGLSSGEFERSAALERLQYFEDTYSPLYDQFFARYEGAGTTEDAVEGGYASIKCIRDFVSLRADNIQPMIDFCEKTLT